MRVLVFAAADEFVAGWMRATENEVIPNMLIFRRISKALARWREFRG